MRINPAGYWMNSLIYMYEIIKNEEEREDEIYGKTRKID